MTRRARLDPSAERDIAEAFAWYEEHRAGLGKELMVALDAALAAIEETPESWGTWRANPRFRRFLVPRFPYVVFFQVVEGDVRIVAVAHAKRRPGYWANR